MKEADVEYYEGLNGSFYKTGGCYGDYVWVLMPFSWIMSAHVKKEDLSNGLFERTTYEEVARKNREARS